MKLLTEILKYLKKLHCRFLIVALSLLWKCVVGSFGNLQNWSKLIKSNVLVRQVDLFCITRQPPLSAFVMIRLSDLILFLMEFNVSHSLTLILFHTLVALAEVKYLSAPAGLSRYPKI